MAIKVVLPALLYCKNCRDITEHVEHNFRYDRHMCQICGKVRKTDHVMDKRQRRYDD